MSADKMPPLPKPSEHGTFPGPHGYSSEDMRAYAAEQTRELVEALELIAGTDPVDAALDPQRAVRVARALIAKHRGQA